MLVSKTHRASETIRGMELIVTVKYPEAATIGPLIDEIAKVFAFARKDPDQLGLFEQKKEEDATE